jgi:prophage antirepressor-like protein
MTTLLDLHNLLLKYNETSIYIAFEDNTFDPWFQAKNICTILKHTNTRKAIRDLVDKKDRKPLDKIVKDYKSLYKNVQGHTIFINEAGLYSLIFSSRMKEAKKIREWVTHDVLPQIRKYGEYKIDEKHKNELKELQRKYDEEVKKRKLIEHDMKIVKYEKGGVVYIMRPILDNIEFSENDIIYLKFGGTNNLNKRLHTYNSTNPHKVQIIKVIKVDDYKNIESCVLKRLDKYRIRKRKEYVECTYNQIINEIYECVKFFEDKEIDKNPEIEIEIEKKYNHKMNRQFNQDIKYEVIILNDDDMQKINIVDKEIMNHQGGIRNDTSLYNNNDSMQSDNNDINENYMKYLKYKIKYLELKYGFSDIN